MRRLMGAAVLVVVLVACRPSTVSLQVRPRVGTTYRYTVDVVADTTTAVTGEVTKHDHQEAHLLEEQTVVTSDPTGVTLRVLLGKPGGTADEFSVQLDGDGTLVAISPAPGTSPDVGAAVGTPEIAPGATAGPGHRVGPGDTWSRGATKARLDELGTAGSTKVARVHATTVQPVSTDRVRGDEHIDQHVAYDVADGTVRDATATTTGHFDLVVPPPARGTVDVVVRSTTRRV